MTASSLADEIARAAVLSAQCGPGWGWLAPWPRDALAWALRSPGNGEALRGAVLYARGYLDALALERQNAR